MCMNDYRAHITFYICTWILSGWYNTLLELTLCRWHYMRGTKAGRQLIRPTPSVVNGCCFEAKLSSVYKLTGVNIDNLKHLTVPDTLTLESPITVVSLLMLADLNPLDPHEVPRNTRTRISHQTDHHVHQTIFAWYNVSIIRQYQRHFSWFVV